MKNVLVALGLIAAMLLAGGTVSAQSDPLAGTWGISTSGTAAIGSATSGACKVSGTVPAALYDVLIQFGHGQILISNLGINIGATNCTSPNFKGTGTYTVADKGNGGFEANGTFTTAFVGRPAACSATALNNVSFTALGKIGDNDITITINGLDSGSYAEGPPPGPTTCKAPILNLTASGTGRRF
jgi:hypothetical protein